MDEAADIALSINNNIILVWGVIDYLEVAALYRNVIVYLSLSAIVNICGTRFRSDWFKLIGCASKTQMEINSNFPLVLKCT